MSNKNNETQENKKNINEVDEEYLQTLMEELDELDDNEAIKVLDEIIDTNDELIEKENMRALAEMDEGLVYYEINGVYKNEKESSYRGRLKMRMNPPKLTIKNSDGDEVNFMLTEQFTEDLVNSLNEVQRAYLGYSTPNKREPVKLKDLPNHVVELIKNNPIRTLATGVVLAFIIYAFIVS